MIENLRLKSGWKTAIRNYPSKNLWKSIKIPCIITAIIVGCIVSCNLLDYDCPLLSVLTKLIDMITAGFPSILGFSIAAYALIIGFSGSSIVKKLHEAKENGVSFYQELSSTFSVMNLWLIITLTFGYVCAFFVSLSLPFIFNSNPMFPFIINLVAIAILVFLLSVSANILFDLVINIYNLTQYIQTLHNAHENENKKSCNKCDEKERTHNNFPNDTYYSSIININNNYH